MPTLKEYAIASAIIAVGYGLMVAMFQLIIFVNGVING